MKRTLVVFAKEPEKGKVKTRLKSQFTDDECLDIYKSFLNNVIKLARGVDCNERIMAYEAEGEPVYLKEAAGDFLFYKQQGRNLGEKMHNALEFARKAGSEQTVIIGSDSPTLPAGFIKEAFDGLEDHDVVIGPSRDGGYYLIGLKQPCKDIFEGIEWSSGTVLGSTLKNVEGQGVNVLLLDEWYDIDTPEDLEWLHRDLKEEG